MSPRTRGEGGVSIYSFWGRPALDVGVDPGRDLRRSCHPAGRLARARGDRRARCQPGVLVVFMLPSLLDGNRPVLVAVVASSVIAFIALYFAHGFTVATSVALLGTFASLAVTALLSWIFVAGAHFTGFTYGNVFYLQAPDGHIDIRGIVLAGFVLGALGVLDDVTVTQVSAVWELRLANAAASPREPYRAAVNIGRGPAWRR